MPHFTVGKLRPIGVDSWYTDGKWYTDRKWWDTGIQVHRYIHKVYRGKVGELGFRSGSV